MRVIGRQLFILVLAGVIGASSVAQADEADCKVVMDAVLKLTRTPVRQAISVESAASPGKPLLSEVVRTQSTMYTQVRGQWMARPYDAKKAAEDAAQTMQKAAHTCRRVRSETVDGHAADLYSVQSKTEQSVVDSQVWISTSTGLPLRQHTEMSGAAKGKHSVRFDYTNVRAPMSVAQ